MSILLVALIAAATPAGQADGGSGTAADAGTTGPRGSADAGQDDEALRRDLEKALGKDAAAAAAEGQTSTAQPAQAPANATVGAAPPVPLLRGAQSLNPDIRVILDPEGEYQRRPL